MSRLAILSALAVSPGLFGIASDPEAEPEPPPPPEQIKAQEKRARKAAKRAMQNQTVNSDSRAVAKLVNAGYPGGFEMPKATLVCPKCGHTARRELFPMAACRGHRETPTETAICPKCRVEMDRPENHLRWTAYNTKAGADRAHWESEK